MFKKKYLEKKIKNVIDLILIFLDKQEIFITEFAFMIYDLCETNVIDKKSIKESLYHVSRNTEKSEKELINFVTQKNLITQLKKIYEENDIL